MASLYELNQAVLAVLENGLVFDEETGEIIWDEENLDALEMERNDKLESVALFIKNLESEAAAIRAEEKLLAERRGVKERKAERMRSYLSDSMTAFGDTRIETPRCVVSFRKSQAVEIEDEALIPSSWITYKPSINKAGIKKALRAGDFVHGAQLVERQNLQIK